MKKIPLGTTGVAVSEICLGAMHIGSNTPPDTSADILNAYVERGGAFIDSANIYNADARGCAGGDSERFLGAWLKERGIREQLFIATKVGMRYPEQLAGLRASQIEEECDKSLKRLGIDTIDLYYAHTDDRDTPLEESLEAFDRMVTSGKVRFVAASNYRATRLVESRCISERSGWKSYCCIQQRYSYLQPRPGADFGIQRAVTDDLLDYCRDHNVALIGYAPMLKGAIAGRLGITLRDAYASDDNAIRLARLNHVALELGVRPTQLTLAWMRHHDLTVIPLIGVSSVKQLNENLDALDIELDTETMERLT
jgi:aryl-alcohol dehydrogenase-like predicted oxidoreductase